MQVDLSLFSKWGVYLGAQHRAIMVLSVLQLFALTGCEVYKQRSYENDFSAEKIMKYDKKNNKTVVHVGDIEMIINQMKLVSNDSFIGFQQEYNYNASYHKVVKMLENKKKVMVLNTEGNLSQFHIYVNQLDFQTSGQIGFSMSDISGYKTYGGARQNSEDVNTFIAVGIATALALLYGFYVYY